MSRIAASARRTALTVAAAGRDPSFSDAVAVGEELRRRLVMLRLLLFGANFLILDVLILVKRHRRLGNRIFAVMVLLLLPMVLLLAVMMMVMSRMRRMSLMNDDDGGRRG